MEYAQAKLPNEIDLYKETTALDMKLDEYIQKCKPKYKLLQILKEDKDGKDYFN